MLIALQDITFEFGSRTIVRDTSWHIMPGERIGLIGLNGSGKSTLLRILNGEFQPSGGTVERVKNLKMGFFNQDLQSFESGDPIRSVALMAFQRVLELEGELEQITRDLEHSQQESLLHRYSDILHEWETLEGPTIRPRAEAILEGLGFTTRDLDRPYREFSGGWRMRVLLARMLLQQPDLLMLDEPTNHLDLPSIEWLERYLIHYEGTVIIVSHDRYFLDRMVTRIVELYQEQLHQYSGNFSFYEKEKAQRREIQQRAYQNQQDYIRQQERFVERFRAKASKASQAQSILKRLDRLDRIEAQAGEAPRIQINFRVSQTPGKVLAQLRNLSKQFGDLKVLEHTSAEISRGNKIALIGANGKGKSTLLRILAGTESYEGERIIGHQVLSSFYAQHQLEALDLDQDILGELKGCGSGRTELDLRSLLGCFLFSGDDVFKKIRILSGGEKARVALAKTIISQANFLLLDEPTNHLDMYSVERLIEALRKYPGTYILVSHDRYFVDRTADRIWEIEEGRIREFPGTFSEWEIWKAGRQIATPRTVREETSDKGLPGLVPCPAPKAQGSINREVKKELQKLQRIFRELETILDRLRVQQQQLESRLTDPEVYADRQKFLECESEYGKVSNRYEETNREYERVFERLMQLEQQLYE